MGYETVQTAVPMRCRRQTQGQARGESRARALEKILATLSLYTTLICETSRWVRRARLSLTAAISVRPGCQNRCLEIILGGLPHLFPRRGQWSGGCATMFSRKTGNARWRPKGRERQVGSPRRTLWRSRTSCPHRPPRCPPAQYSTRRVLCAVVPPPWTCGAARAALRLANPCDAETAWLLLNALG